MFCIQPHAAQTLFSIPKPAKQETKIEIQLKTSQDLKDLLQHKTKQVTAYKKIILINSNWHWRHQMVQSFLWLQENKDQDNLYKNRQDLARIVA